MPIVLNCLDEDNTVVVGGNHFVFKPRQIKHFYQPEIAKIITTTKAEFGFSSLPDAFEDLEYRATPEAKAIVEEKRKEGVENYCRRLRSLIYNAQVSLRTDLEKANIKADPKHFASDGDVHSMEQLIKYQSKHEDVDQARVERLKELEKQLEKQGTKLTR